MKQSILVFILIGLMSLNYAQEAIVQPNATVKTFLDKYATQEDFKLVFYNSATDKNKQRRSYPYVSHRYVLEYNNKDMTVRDSCLSEILKILETETFTKKSGTIGNGNNDWDVYYRKNNELLDLSNNPKLGFMVDYTVFTYK